MKKFSFQNAKEVLENSKLLLKVSKLDGISVELARPQNQVDRIQSGDIFIAFQGTKVDAHDFIARALNNGAKCLVVENEAKIPDSNTVPYFVVSDSRAAWSVLCALAYQNPEKKMKFYGVTGTDGKTSTVWMASQLVRLHSGRCLSIGTLGIFDGTSHWNIDHTTPDPPVFFSALENANNSGISSVIMEVSSHSLIQGKLQNLNFDCAVFTSFTRDHLDFHKTIEEYWNAKSLLFTKHLTKNAKIIINDHVSKAFTKIKTQSQNLWAYGLDHTDSQKNHVRILECKPGENGQYIKFQIHEKTYEGEIPYLGTHNAENFIAALLIAKEILSFVPPKESWMKLLPVPGRCERIRGDFSAPKVFVDFAHTPDGLKTILRTLRTYTKGKLWIVFGCGGDRDHGKRPEMAKAAELSADKLILSSDNPRTEDPQTILDQMKTGLRSNSEAIAIVDREKAIEFAISKASLEDTILIAGKGHEAYQIIGDKKIPFSDQNLAMHYLKLFWGRK